MTSDLPDLAQVPARAPVAAQDQADVQAFEYGLLALAHRAHPTVAWWHGYRKLDGRYGSFCYLCERFIATWVALEGIPQSARDAIGFHKLDHRAGTVPASESTTTEGTPS